VHACVCESGWVGVCACVCVCVCVCACVCVCVPLGGVSVRGLSPVVENSIIVFACVCVCLCVCVCPMVENKIISLPPQPNECEWVYGEGCEWSG
jgi:hypothetical protein